MTHRRNQQGFAIIELLLILVIVGIIAFVTWRVIEATGAVKQAQNQVPTSTTVPTATVATPQNASDLSTLQQQLNGTAVDDNSATDLDTQTTF